MTSEVHRAKEELRVVATRALPLLDLTGLGDDDTAEDIEALCAAAVTPIGSVAAVCVWPQFVELARRSLTHDSRVLVASVANFPEGRSDPISAAADGLAIVESGADEVDVVFPWRSLAAGDESAGARLVREVRSAARIALGEGADFLSTSTGTTPTSAGPDASSGAPSVR